MSPIKRVLDLARWAPSGDNTQPWRFEIVSETECIVHAFDTRDHCVYDLTGAPSQIAVGAMLETAKIAATGLGMGVATTRDPHSPEERPRFRLRLFADASIKPSQLIEAIETRCTNRRPFSRRALTTHEKRELEASVAPGYVLHWLEGARRWDMAKLLFRSAKIRLTIREAYDVHARVIEWHARYSEMKIPDAAVGLDPIGLALMRWAMKSWARTNVLSKYFGGTLLPRIQLELLPALSCAAHVLIVASRPLRGIDDFVAGGRVVQRFWLTATRLQLQHQPEMTPLIFATYNTQGRAFSADRHAIALAAEVRQALAKIAGDIDLEQTLWIGRIGDGSAPSARSLRLPMADLMASQAHRYE